MNILKGSHSVLSGAIDRVENDGVEWRKYIKRRCEELDLGILFFDPCDKPKHLGSEIGIEKQKVKILINSGKWEEARKYVKEFRHFDLRAVDRCDFMIAKIDINIHICGTYNELFTAENQLKPIFIIMGEGQKKEDIPTWLISFIKEENIFESEDECIDRLIKIDNGEIELDEKWVKIYL